MSLTIKEIEHLANLAHLELNNEEKEKYSQEISSILQYVDKIQELRVTQQLSNQEVINIPLKPREDRVVGMNILAQEDLIKQAPEKQNNLIKTKAVFKE
jgi:aspartyl-tRNA(Asn)/glutamyl-tRNA(Gln) amidotransferase subunit C